MTRKTESLSYPTNPLAAMRELQNLDAVPNGRKETTQVSRQSPEVALPSTLPTSSATTNATSSEVANATSSEVASATSGEESSATHLRQRKRQEGAKAKAAEPNDGDGGDAVANAVWDMLAQPYKSDPRKGPFTVSTVKIPTEISDRLGWVARITGKPRQEILAEALKDHFSKILSKR